MTQSYQKPDPISTRPWPRLFALIQAERHTAGAYKFEAYYSASYLAESLYDHKTPRALMQEVLKQAGRCDNLPLSQPDWSITRTSNAYTAIPGEVMHVTAEWPSDRELAL